MFQKTLKIIAVDDEPSQLKWIKLFLEKIDKDLIVETFNHPYELQERIKETHYDCILSDYELPGMNGVELALKVKEFKDIPFVLYTGRGSEEIVLEAFAAGVEGYVRKEVDPEHYKKVVREIRKAIERGGRSKSVDFVNNDSLPDFPKAIAQGRSVIILYEDGTKQIWSEEVDEFEANRVAEEIQRGLQLRYYVRFDMYNYLNGLVEKLQSLDVPKDELEDIIFEGYRGLNKVFNQLWQFLSSEAV